MGAVGEDYFYNNPTCSRGGLERQPWYSIPCCPSNISRTYADLGKYIASYEDGNLWLHQYISAVVKLPPPFTGELHLESGLPWKGRVKGTFADIQAQTFTLHLRLPSWVEGCKLTINGEAYELPLYRKVRFDPTACGFDPRQAFDLPVTRQWADNDVFELTFDLPVRFLHAHDKVHALRGKVALARGPLLYCLETVDHPGVDIFNETLDGNSLQVVEGSSLFEGASLIKARSINGNELVFIPYAFWGNRGESGMTVWLNQKGERKCGS